MAEDLLPVLRHPVKHGRIIEVRHGRFSAQRFGRLVGLVETELAEFGAESLQQTDVALVESPKGERHGRSIWHGSAARRAESSTATSRRATAPISTRVVSRCPLWPVSHPPPLAREA